MSPDGLTTVVMIAACGVDGALGRDGDLPWSCPADMRHFKELTMGAVCVMGRRTADSLPYALPGRTCVVLTSDTSWSRDGFIAIHGGLEALWAWCAAWQHDTVWCIGGGVLYRAMMPYTDVLHLTRLDIAVPDADTHFPLDMIDAWTGVVARPSDDPRVCFHTYTPQRVASGYQRTRPCTVMDLDVPVAIWIP